MLEASDWLGLDSMNIMESKQQPLSRLIFRIFIITEFNMEDMIDHRSYAHNLSICEIKASQSGQHPVGLIAQLVDHCAGIAEVMGSNPIQA